MRIRRVVSPAVALACITAGLGLRAQNLKNRNLEKEKNNERIRTT